MIGFLGLSHLGLVSAVAAAAHGSEVVGYDEDDALVERLRGGDLPVSEPGLSELLERVSARLALSADPADLGRCELLYVAVDVPTDTHDASDLAPVEHLLDVAAGAAGPGTAIVVLSQVTPGFTRAHLNAVQERGATLSYQVETLVFGRAVDRALRPERFIVGCADPAAPLPGPLTRHLSAYGCPILPMRFESAELCKIAINAFLVSTLTTTNTLAELCEAICADWHEIAPALRLDARIGPGAYLTPGLGFGGSNLSRDLATIERLAGQSGTDAGVVGSWRAHARHRRDWVLGQLARRTLAGREGARIAIWGLAYKEDTQSVRNSPGLALARTLTAAGVAVTAFDPQAEALPQLPPAFTRVGSALAACDGADALAVMTPWAEFRTIDPVHVAARLDGSLIVDPHSCLDAAAGEAAGIVHVRLGVG